MTNRRTFLQQTSLSAASLLLPSSVLAGLDRRLAAPNQASTAANAPAELRFRQVHLDFHTPETIRDIASKFDPDEFASTLQRARVNSVTCFGRCHHGYIYHDTQRFPERHHPHLSRNLLKEQIEACHKRNIRVPVYITVQWDHFSARQHPEWLMRDAEGRPMGQKSQFEPGFYDHLCVLTPYRDFLFRYVDEVFQQVPVDGVFFDIVHALPNANRESIAAMQKLSLDPADELQRAQYAARALQEFKAEMTDYIRKRDPKATIFYNGGHVGPKIRPDLPSYTHLELESLPSGGWGYLHFPLTARYARTLGKGYLGMTGKFHTSWGDFHSLKNRPALEFETNLMLALGAQCAIGDQLHPLGQLDPATYDLIGSVYKQIEEKEPWCRNARAVTEIGILTPEEFFKGEARQVPAALGAVRLLQEGRHQFDFVDSQSDFRPYKLLVLPDSIVVNAALKQKLETFIQSGGKLLASHRSGLNEAGTAFALPLGIEYVGEAPYSPDFIVTEGPLATGLPRTELVMYQKGLQVKPNGATVLAQTNVPYFNRTWEHFASHRHTPSSGQAGYPAITESPAGIYFMHPIFGQYHQNAPRWCKQLVLNALDRLLPDPLVRTDGPSTLIATLNEQPAERRRVLHLLSYVPERRGVDFDVVEDVIPLQNVGVSLRVAGSVRRLTRVPENQPLRFRQSGNRISFVLPELNGHQMIVIE